MPTSAAGRAGGRQSSIAHARWRAVSRRATPISALLCALAAVSTPRLAEPAPKVASINLCTDQLLLTLADPKQILSLSWLAADPEESMRAAQAQRYPLNYGNAEEILRHAPDIVLAGTYTSAFTRQMLVKLGYRVVEVAPAQSVAEIERNLEQVGGAIGQSSRAVAAIETMRARLATFARSRPAATIRAVVLRPGGFTVGAGSLAEDLLSIAGLTNVPTEQGLDRWGSLSMETLLHTRPEILILTGYRLGDPSLANTVFAHPALRRMRAATPAIVVPSAQWSCGMPDSLDSVEIMQSAARALEPRMTRRAAAEPGGSVR